MSQPFVGEIRIFAGSFAPAGWAMCDGSLVPISSNDTLFQLIGTTYGGDGQTTFALPNLGGRVPIHAGTNLATGTTFTIGQIGGVEQVTLTTQQIPAHNHPFIADDSATATVNTDPTNHIYGNTASTNIYSIHTAGLKQMMTLGQAGGSQPHSNQQPFLTLTYIISLFGVFPSQT